MFYVYFYFAALLGPDTNVPKKRVRCVLQAVFLSGDLLLLFTHPKTTPTVQCLDRGQLPHSWSDGCVSPDDAGYLSIERLLRRFVSFLSTCGKKRFFSYFITRQVSQERSTTPPPRLLVVIYNCCNTKDVRTI